MGITSEFGKEFCMVGVVRMMTRSDLMKFFLRNKTIFFKFRFNRVHEATADKRCRRMKNTGTTYGKSSETTTTKRTMSDTIGSQQVSNE